MPKYTPLNGSKYPLRLTLLRMIDQNISLQSDGITLYLYCYCCDKEIWR